MMTYTDAAPRPSRFQMGEALQSIFDAVFANFAVFALLALTLSAVPTFLTTVAFGPPATRLASPGLAFGGGLAGGVVALASSALLQGALVRGVILHLNGERPRFGPCLRAGLSVAAPLVAIGLLFGIAVTVGFVLLIAPGLFLVALWGVAAPAQVVERAGVFGSFSRSADLTAGHRWAVLGTLILLGIAGFVVIVIGSAVVGLFGGLSIFAGGAAAARVAASQGWGLFLFSSAFSAAVNAVAAIFSNAAPAVIYYQLRRAKEGAAPAALAAVFD